MKILNEKSILEINSEKQDIENRENAIESLATQLATEKIKSMQKDVTIKQLSSEIATIKIDVMKIKGGII